MHCTAVRWDFKWDRKLSGDYFREQKYGRKPILVGRGKRLTPKRRKWKRVISILDLTLVDDEISARFVCHAYLPLGEDLCPLGTVEIPWALVTSLTAAIAAHDQKFLLPGGCWTPYVKWGLVHDPFRRGELFSLNLLSFWLLDWNSSWVDVEAEFCYLERLTSTEQVCSLWTASKGSTSLLCNQRTCSVNRWKASSSGDFTRMK